MGAYTLPVDTMVWLGSVVLAVAMVIGLMVSGALAAGPMAHMLIAEVKGEPVAFSMTLPDANYALKAAGGRLTKWGLPIGLLKLLLASRRIRRLRLITLGIKEGFRKRGIDAVLYLETITTAKKLGYTGGEISWTLEDNHLVNRAIEMMGGKRTKTYRIYRKAL